MIHGKFGGELILERIRQGDGRAFDELVEEVWTPLCDHLEFRLGSRDAAEDAAQEAFVRIWEHRERWEGASATALAFRIGRNVATDQQRRRKVRELHAESAKQAISDTTPTPDQIAAASEMNARVVKAVSQLPERRREVFEMVRYAGLSYAEVAESLGLSTQTVANHLSLALRDLRTELYDLIERDHSDSEAKNSDG